MLLQTIYGKNFTEIAWGLESHICGLLSSYHWLHDILSCGPKSWPQRYVGTYAKDSMVACDLGQGGQVLPRPYSKVSALHARNKMDALGQPWGRESEDWAGTVLGTHGASPPICLRTTSTTSTCPSTHSHNPVSSMDRHSNHQPQTIVLPGALVYQLTMWSVGEFGNCYTYHHFSGIVSHPSFISWVTCCSANLYFQW